MAYQCRYCGQQRQGARPEGYTRYECPSAPDYRHHWEYFESDADRAKIIEGFCLGFDILLSIYWKEILHYFILKSSFWCLWAFVQPETWASSYVEALQRFISSASNISVAKLFFFNILASIFTGNWIIWVIPIPLCFLHFKVIPKKTGRAFSIILIVFICFVNWFFAQGTNI